MMLLPPALLVKHGELSHAAYPRQYNQGLLQARNDILFASILSEALAA